MYDDTDNQSDKSNADQLHEASSPKQRTSQSSNNLKTHPAAATRHSVVRSGSHDEIFQTKKIEAVIIEKADRLAHDTEDMVTFTNGSLFLGN
jgi:hypothetical protein